MLTRGVSAFGTSFGKVPGLAENRQVVALEMQAHGLTADIDRPLSLELIASLAVIAVAVIATLWITDTREWRWPLWSLPCRSRLTSRGQEPYRSRR
jgi:hypothetical protein